MFGGIETLWENKKASVEAEAFFIIYKRKLIMLDPEIITAIAGLVTAIAYLIKTLKGKN